MQKEDKSRLLALLGLMFAVFSAVVALLFVFGPALRAPSRSGPAAGGPSVFGDTRSSAELQSKISSQQYAGRERGSALDNIRSGGRSDPSIMERLRAVEERLAQARARLAQTGRGGETWKLVKKAENIFFNLKNSKRFAKSKDIADMKEDFLSYPDLRKINEDYYEKDGSTINFIRKALKSPNFGKVVKKHINKPDVHAFLTSMMGSPDVMQASKALTDEYDLQPDIDRLDIPGVGSLGKMKQKGEEFKRGKKMNNQNTAELLGIDPGMLDPNAIMRKAEEQAASSRDDRR